MWKMFDASDDEGSDTDFDDTPTNPLAWTCELCAFVNELKTTECEVCEYPRQSQEQKEAITEAEFIQRSAERSIPKRQRQVEPKQTDDSFASYWNDSQSSKDWLKSLPSRPIIKSHSSKRSKAKIQDTRDVEITDERVRKFLRPARDILRDLHKQNPKQRFSILNVMSQNVLDHFQWESESGVMEVFYAGGGRWNSNIVDGEYQDKYGIGVCSSTSIYGVWNAYNSFYIGLASNFTLRPGRVMKKYKFPDSVKMDDAQNFMPCYMIQIDGGVDFPDENSMWFRPTLQYEADLCRISIPHERSGEKRKRQRSWNWRYGYGSGVDADSM